MKRVLSIGDIASSLMNDNTVVLLTTPMPYTGYSPLLTLLSQSTQCITAPAFLNVTSARHKDQLSLKNPRHALHHGEHAANKQGGR